MKHFTIVLLVILGNLPAYSQDDEDSIGYVVYVDSVPSVSSVRQAKKLTRPRRSPSEVIVLSRKGKMKAKCTTDDEEIRDGMLRCLRVAMDVWEESVEINQQVTFKVNLTYDIDPALEIKTEVAYSRLGRWSSKVYSLYSQEHSTSDVNNSISINADVNWDYSWIEDVDSGEDNLITALLRHIGHILGFGSSITTINGQLGFAINRCSSDFDNLIYNSQNVCLGNIAQTATSSALSLFLMDTLNLSLPSVEYGLYSNHIANDPCRDAKYFSLADDNIMNYPYGDRSLLMGINKETLDALAAIGWTVRPHSMKIGGNNVNEVGYGSAYKSHTFQITDANNIVQNATWKYQIYSNSIEQYVDVSTGYGSPFTINNINFTSDAIDNYDCLQGRIVCCVTQNGTTSEFTKPLFLELKPELVNYEILNINTATGNNFYSFDLKLTHLGTSQGFLSVNNEYGLTSSFNFSGDGETVIHVGNAFKYGQTYIYITLRNEYGDNVKTIYLDNPINSLQNSRAETSMPYLMALINDVPAVENSVVQHGDSLDLVITGLENKENQKYEFKWELIFRNGEETLWSETLGTRDETCSFRILPQLFRKSERDLSFELIENRIRVLNEKRNKYYYKGFVKASIKENGRWSRYLYYPIIIDVLPEKPAIRLLKYEEVTGEYTNILYPVAHLEIETSDFLNGEFFTTQGTVGAYGLSFEQGTPMPLQVDIDWGYLNCGYGCVVMNEYGCVRSDTIFPDRNAVNVTDKPLEQVRVKQVDRFLSVTSPYPLDEISVVSLSGNICLSRKKTATLNEELSRGVYIVRFGAKHEIRTKKIIIK